MDVLRDTLRDFVSGLAARGAVPWALRSDLRDHFQRRDVGHEGQLPLTAGGIDGGDRVNVVSVSAVPVSVASNGDSLGITGIEFNPANPNIIFAASYGNGVYQSVNGGSSWSVLSGGPGSVNYAAISSAGMESI